MRAIDVRDLLSHPGASKTVRLDESLEGLRTELASVPDDAPLAGDLVLEGVMDGVYASGSVAGTMILRCARCLKGFQRDFEVEMGELFARQPGPEDDYGLDPDFALDPEPMVRDAVVLAMPFSPTCKPDCLGLCERCGGDRNLGGCHCYQPPADPRWAQLGRLVDEP
ncbi:MAG: YceD family protein [Actinomycetota bacterium]